MVLNVEWQEDSLTRNIRVIIRKNRDAGTGVCRLRRLLRFGGVTFRPPALYLLLIEILGDFVGVIVIAQSRGVGLQCGWLRGQNRKGTLCSRDADAKASERVCWISV